MRHPSPRASSLWGLLRWKKTAYCSLDNPKTCIVSLPSSAHATPRLTRAAIRAYVYVKNSAVICVCDIDRVPHFKQMNELVALMCFFRKNTRVCGFVGGNDKKLNQNSRKLIDVVETILCSARKGSWWSRRYQTVPDKILRCPASFLGLQRLVRLHGGVVRAGRLEGFATS